MRLQCVVEIGKVDNRVCLYSNLVLHAGQLMYIHEGKTFAFDGHCRHFALGSALYHVIDSIEQELLIISDVKSKSLRFIVHPP